MVLHLYDKNLDGVFNLNSVEFNELILTDEAISNILDFAKTHHPNEFVALLGGTVDNKKLKIHDASFKLSKASELKIDLPFLTNIVGSVHSHPGSTVAPSKEDLEVFDRRGGIHFIVSYPFNAVNIRAYNCVGKEIKFKLRKK